MIGFPRHQDWRRQELVLYRLESLMAFFGPHKLDTLFSLELPKECFSLAQALSALREARLF